MPVATPVDSTWRLIFDDEFVGPSLRADRWGANWLGAAGAITKPVNAAETAAYDPAQVSVSGGLLHLTAIAKSVAVAGKTYANRSGLVHTDDHFRFTYGYAEARINCPGIGGKIANWPAFWCDGQNWPADGELDIFEGLSGNAAWHFHSPSGGPGGNATGDFTGWHVYGAFWEPGRVTWLYDGKQVGTLASGITGAPLFLILNNGVGGYGGPPLIPADMQVDYVHVYSPDSRLAAVSPDAGYGGPGDDKSAPPPVSAADAVLTRALGKLADVAVVGRDSSGKRYLDSTP